MGLILVREVLNECIATRTQKCGADYNNEAWSLLSMIKYVFLNFIYLFLSLAARPVFAAAWTFPSFCGLSLAVVHSLPLQCLVAERGLLARAQWLRPLGSRAQAR